MNRLYLSGPITGQPHFMDVFNRAQAKLAAEGYQVINPANLAYVMPSKATWNDFMNIDMELLRMCDVLVQLPGWEQSLGCRQEYGMALERDMIILRLEDLLDGCTKKSRN